MQSKLLRFYVVVRVLEAFGRVVLFLRLVLLMLCLCSLRQRS